MMIECWNPKAVRSRHASAVLLQGMELHLTNHISIFIDNVVHSKESRKRLIPNAPAASEVQGCQGLQLPQVQRSGVREAKVCSQ